MPYQAASTSLPRADLLATFMEGGQLFKSPIAQLVFTPVPVPSNTGSFGFIAAGQMTRRDGARDGVRRAPDGSYPSIDYKFADLTYDCTEDGVEHRLDDSKVARYGGLLNMEQAGTKILMNRLQLEREFAVIGQLHDTGTFTGATNTLAITNEWDDATNADPVADIQVGIDAIIGKCGEAPNVLAIGERAWRDLWTLDKIRDRIKYVVTSEIPDYSNAAARIQLGKLLGVEEVLVGDVQYNSALENATAVISNAWDPEYAVLLKVARTGDLTESCCGRTFYYEPDGGLGVLEEYNDERRRSRFLRHRHCIQAKRLSTAHAFLFSNVYTA